MWRVLRAELAYSRPFLLGGLAIAAGVIGIVSVVFYAVGREGPPDQAVAAIRAMFVLMAPLIVGFISHSSRAQERRVRLLLAGTLTPRQIVGAEVLLPVVLLGVGLAAAGLALGIGSLVTESFSFESLNITVFLGGQLFAYAQMALLAKESAAAHSQRRRRAAAAGWTCFAAAAVVLAGLYLLLTVQRLTWAQLIVGHLAVAAVVMAGTVALFTGRTDFTR